MTKELVIERYGELKYTMGNGGSAATMQQHLLAENYPGLLDALTTSQAFEDHWTQVQGSFDCRVLMHYFWPTSPLTLPGHAAAPPNPLFPTAAARLPVWGSHPSNPDNLCGQKVLLFGADRTELVPGSGVGCGLAPELIWHPTNNPGGERCGIADFMRAVFGVTVTPDAPKGKGRLAVDNVGVQYGLRGAAARRDHRRAVRRPQHEDRRHRHRRQLRPAAHGGRPGRAADRLRDRPHQQRHGRGEHPGARRAHRQPARRHRLPSGVPLVLLPRAPRQGQRPSRQPGHLAPAAGRDRAEPVRRHAQLARQRRQAARHVLHAGRSRGRPDLQRLVAVLRRPAARGRLALQSRRRQVPAQAAGARRLPRRDVHRPAVGAAGGDVPDRRLRLLQAGREPATAEGALADVRRRARRRAARPGAGAPRSSRRAPSAAPSRPRCRSRSGRRRASAHSSRASRASTRRRLPRT